jgi:hypothetical protein
MPGCPVGLWVTACLWSLLVTWMLWGLAASRTGMSQHVGGVIGTDVLWVRLGCVDDVRELDAGLDEEHGDVVADQVEGAFVTEPAVP